ncbi:MULTISPECIES: hypothetical protein [unclassified Gordonia (in: high G+C Gram-positive bacteria)]|uniref:hypothetical protein n=1 Tax=unclassified Gordonia (in: high G+C Gram-positive bacteria) TaxID=2657482 RepID=UPI0007EBFB75|nr:MULTISPECIES: hypothetical protein [unclassified Gordonia (in: high G+C Gram-positive bacteria)]OBA43188.1 hypothetical protein A5766_18185 [Gordonia sp. 852002-51296_SCH5728562-b]OBA64679.1 hypothetical protein A5777_21745 [Gordonia sp. 852002-10350_SCH5691597]
MTALLLIIIVVVLVVGVVVVSQQRSGASKARSLDDAKADARQVIERLGGQVYMLVGDSPASKQALADAGERYTAAGSQIDQANSPAQARLAKQTAIEGLYYIRAARTAMNMDPGPAIPELDGQRSAGAVTEDRTVEFDGRQVEASPAPSSRTPNYYPGGRVAGRPVPAGWYSEPWWKPALVAGAWGVGSMLLFSTLFSGMHGVPYDAAAFENGAGDGSDMAGIDGGGDDFGGDGGDDFGGGDGFDGGSGFDGGGDGGFDFGGFDF